MLITSNLQDHEEVELLLESFKQEINTLANVLESMGTRLRNTNSLIKVPGSSMGITDRVQRQ